MLAFTFKTILNYKAIFWLKYFNSMHLQRLEPLPAML